MLWALQCCLNVCAHPFLFWLLLTLPIVSLSAWRTWEIRKKEKELKNAMDELDYFYKEHENAVVCAWKRITELSKLEATRLCPICMDADAVTEYGELCGIACANGHPLCRACTGRLIRYAKGVAYMECPTCRCVCFIPVEALCRFIQSSIHSMI